MQRSSTVCFTVSFLNQPIISSVYQLNPLTVPTRDAASDYSLIKRVVDMVFRGEFSVFDFLNVC
jgi:hypothetical protein